MIGQLVIVKVTLPICIIQPVLNYSYLVYHCCKVQVCVMLLQWQCQGGGKEGGKCPPKIIFCPPILPPPQFLIISVETISR